LSQQNQLRPSYCDFRVISSATSRLVCIWIMMLSSPLLLRPLRFLRSLRSHDLVLFEPLIEVQMFAVVD